MKKSLNNYINSLVNKIINETIEEKADELVTKLTEGDKMVCDECGSGNMYEGECTECGYKMGSELPEEQSFDYVAEEEEFGSDPEGRTKRFCDTSSKDYNEATCKYHEQNFMGGEMSEKLHGRQSKIDVAEPKGKITGADFKKLRSMKRGTDEEVEESMIPGIGDEYMKKHREGVLRSFKKHYPDDEHLDKELRKKNKDGEMEEGNTFTGALAKAKKEGDKTFEVGGKKFNVKESKKSIQMTESEMIEFIERIVLQEEEKLKSMGKTKGLNVYQKAHTASGKENKEYLQSVVKKMKEYLKDGSKGDYDMNPEIFPKGNGELAKMDKKAYTPSDAVQDYTDNLTAAGQENLDYDEIHPNEKWVDDNVEGSSRTGNNPEWANTGKSDINKKRNKVRKDNMLAKIKRKAYNKAPQPILQDKSGDDSGSKLMMKLESTDEKTQQKINEEFDRMKNLIGYNQKTQ